MSTDAGDGISNQINHMLNDGIESKEELELSSHEECNEDVRLDPSDHLSQIFTESDFLETQNMLN